MHHYNWFPRLATTAVFLVTAALFLLITSSTTTAESPADHITQAWERAIASGQYDFRTRVEQTTYPELSIRSGGAQPELQIVGLEGQVDLPSELHVGGWQF